MKSVIWAPWRMGYVGAERDPGECIFCSALEADTEEERRRHHVLLQTPKGGVMLNLYPYNNAHLLVFPARHAPGPLQLSDAEFTALSLLWKESLAIIGRVISPEGVNGRLNLGACAGAGVVDHVHLHLVPRWNGDTNFMPVLGEVKVMPESLDATWEKLSPHFRGLQDDPRFAVDPSD